ncbi:MAG TPA: alanyl-tRNA synthetase [Blastocatellia bacterium]|nr:alanyl-tRNA synthetase [Blastocatellia bacterium]HMX26308.1 alanyl-tRNA synthetase [Blastocatellia bacterium]HMY71158.1 alanyl-tRNA synthetase [Blastocatellia bacterium]HMZ20814.1 alanyl-tRNA synthetase [Blastocatellia bacterium]HNG31663.1 alanyl-tRNA synthetase [Blastocatellia bacterium]
MDEPANTTDLPPSEQPRQHSIVAWLRRLGLAGALFFLVKGLLWILIPVLVAKGCL